MYMNDYKQVLLDNVYKKKQYLIENRHFRNMPKLKGLWC